MLKTLFFLLLFSFSLLPNTIASGNDPKKCDFRIDVGENRQFKGKVYYTKEIIKKYSMTFTETMILVKMPNNGNPLVMELDNSDCHGYCPRMKRVRQLNSEDEGFVKNIVRRHFKEVETILQKCQ